jgi:uncharacterized protein (TIGR00730 family)
MKGKIAVFCSASYTIDPKYNKVAREFVRAASLRGYGIVSGGTIKGTMGEISEELRDCGGWHLGVIPRFMKQYVYPELSEVIWTDTMAERKMLLRQGTCAVVALPGGIGTLDEIVDTFTLLSLGQYEGKVCLLNVDGFYDPFVSLLKKYVDEKMMAAETFEKLVVASSVEELLSKI